MESVSRASSCIQGLFSREEEKGPWERGWDSWKWKCSKWILKLLTMAYLSPEYITFLLPYIVMSFWSLSRTWRGLGEGFCRPRPLWTWITFLMFEQTRKFSWGNWIWSVSVHWRRCYHGNLFLKWKTKIYFYFKLVFLYWFWLLFFKRKYFLLSSFNFSAGLKFWRNPETQHRVSK